MRPSNLQDYRPDIDGLRALAIVSVVIFHAFPAEFAGGFIGVDVFFVISGFLITRILLKHCQAGTFTFTDFYARRIRRIFPALIVVLAACLVMGWFALLAHEYRQLGKHVAAAAGFVSNLALLGEAGYFDNASETKPLLHLWSLGIEEQFYLLWPVLIWWVWKKGLNQLAVMGLVVVVSFAWNIWLVKTDQAAAFYLPQTRVWELAVGGLLACVELHRKPRFLHGRSNPWNESVPHGLSLLGAGLLLYGFVTIDKADAFPGWQAWIPVLGVALVLRAGGGAWLNRTVLARPAMVWVGLISFPLYLWHWPLLSLARIIEGQTPSLLVRLGAVLLAVSLAWATYALLEKRIARPTRAKAKTIALLTVLFLLGAAGYWVYQGAGLPGRAVLANLPPPIQKLEEDEASQRSSCMAQYGMQAEKMRYCRLSIGAAPPSVALVGDSHAAALFSGLSEVLKHKNNEGLLMMGGWLFVDAILYPEGKREETESYTGGGKATAFVAREKSIDTVIMAARGPVFINTHHPFHLLNRPEIVDKKLVYETALRSVLDLMLENGKKIIFVLEVPTLGVDPEACQDRRPVRLSAHAHECRISRAAYEASHGEYRKRMAAVLKDYPAVRVFDPAAYLCDQSYCYGKHDGTVLYGDDNHLSHGGSSLLAQELGRVLEDIRAPAQ